MNKFLNKFLNKKAQEILRKGLANILRKTMRVGVSYNLFDGEELLPFSINSVRGKVQHISVIYQLVSNFGHPASVDLEKKLKKLKEEGLIDEIYLYEPNLKLHPQQNEKNKRDIGLKLAKKNGCNYFISLDADEFYDEEQFDNALDYIVLNNIKTSAVSIVEYLKSPENQLVGAYTFTPKNTELYNFYVPFVMKIDKFKTQKHGEGYFPCYTDPTRKLFHNGRFKLFSMQDVVMHHMSTVRLDLSKKYDNTSALDDSKEKQNDLRTIQNEILEFDFEKNKILPEDCSIFKKNIVRKVQNKFNINFD